MFRTSVVVVPSNLMRERRMLQQSVSALATATLILCLVPAVGAAADQTVADIQEQAVGLWEREMKRQGQTFRIVKDVDVGKETVSVYDTAGELVRQSTLNYTIEIAPANVCVFRMFDREFTVGPRKGEKVPEAGAYAFRIHNDKWHEIHNLPLGEGGGPRFNVFQRVSETTPSDGADNEWQANEWSKLVGVWKASYPNNRYRIKRVSAGKETLEEYNAAGKLLRKSTTDMKIERLRGLNFFTVRSGTPRQYTSIYKVHKGKWYEQLRGIFADSKMGPPDGFLVYEKVEE